MTEPDDLAPPDVDAAPDPWADIPDPTLEPAEVRLAVLSTHSSFVERFVSEMHRVGLPCEVDEFKDEYRLRRALAETRYDAVLVDHRQPQSWARRGDAVVGFRGLKVVVTTPDRFDTVHPRYDRVVATGDTLRLAVVLASLAERRRSRTAAREAEQARRQAERRLDLLKEVSGTAVVTVRVDGSVESCNAAAERLFRLPENRLLDHPITRFVSGVTERYLEREEGWVLLTDVDQIGRDALSVEVRGFPLPDGGAILLVDRQGGPHAQALQAARRRLDLLAEMLPGVIYILRVDPDGDSPDQFVWVAPGSDAVLGDEIEYTRASTRSAFIDRIPDADADGFRDFVARAARTGEVATVEHRFDAPDGSRLWLRHYATAVWSTDSRVLALYGLMLDVTTEVAARERTDLLSRAIEQTADMVMITGEDGTIEYVNPVFETVTGYTAEEVIGENPRMLRSGRLTGDFYREMFERLTAGESIETVFENRRKTGEIYLQRAMISPVTDRHGVTRYLAIAREVTTESGTADDIGRFLEGGHAADDA